MDDYRTLVLLLIIGTVYLAQQATSAEPETDVHSDGDGAPKNVGESESRTAKVAGKIGTLSSWSSSRKLRRSVADSDGGDAENEAEVADLFTLPAEESKRQWGDRFEDKRKWSANSMAVWGKRGSVDDDSPPEEQDKRKWKADNMAVWGKRNVVDSAQSGTKRKWKANSMAVWGKRDLEMPGNYKTLFGVYGRRTMGEGEKQEEKRKWSPNAMAVWGR